MISSWPKTVGAIDFESISYGLDLRFTKFSYILENLGVFLDVLLVEVFELLLGALIVVLEIGVSGLNILGHEDKFVVEFSDP